MNIKRAKQEIKDTIAAYLQKDAYGGYVIPAIRQRPVLLIGPPGVGKTQIMEQIAQECQIGLAAYTITHHTRQSAIGLPMIERREYGGREYAVTEYTMSEIVGSVYERMEATGLKEGILFIDEINCVSETLAPVMLQFLQAKTFGTHRIPEGWVIVAAGNPPEYNKSVREFDIVTLDRIRRIDVEPDLAVWKEYAAAGDIHPAVRDYVSVRPGNFCRIETTVDGRMFATPRGWEDLSQLIQVYESLGKRADRELIQEYIQFPGIAKDFANYLELYYKYKEDYQVDRVLAGEISEAAAERLGRAAFDERVSVTGLLLSGLNESFRKVGHLARELELRRERFKELQEAGVFADGGTGAGREAGVSADGGASAGQEAGVFTDGGAGAGRAAGISAGGGAGSGQAAATAFADMLERFQEERERRRESGLLSRMEYQRERGVAAALEADLQALRGMDLTSAGQAWELLRERFGADSDRYEALVDEAGAKLEHAFDFLEAAFGSGQEMTLFVTELNSGYYSVGFLKEYPCERYYQYNRDLLFSDEEQEIRDQLSRMG